MSDGSKSGWMALTLLIASDLAARRHTKVASLAVVWKHKHRHVMYRKEEWIKNYWNTSIVLVFFTLIHRRLLLHHSDTRQLASNCNLSWTTAKFRWDVYKSQSSAYKIILQSVTTSHISLIYNVNNKGPKTETCVYRIGAKPCSHFRYLVRIQTVWHHSITQNWKTACMVYELLSRMG